LLVAPPGSHHQCLITPSSPRPPPWCSKHARLGRSWILRLKRVITATTLCVIRSVILTPVTASATSQGLVCSTAPKTRSSRPAFPGDRHRPRSAVTRAIVFGFLGGPCSCSLFRNRALLDASHRSALHFLSHFVDSPRSDFRVLPEGFPGIPGSPELSVKLHLHKRLPHDLLASALLGALAVKPGLADRATSERRPTQRATHNTARLSAHPPAPLHPCTPVRLGRHPLKSLLRSASWTGTSPLGWKSPLRHASIGSAHSA
jgi:hypothetical protein